MQQADTKDQKNESGRQNWTRGRHTCTDGIDILVPNRTFRFPEWNENSSDNTDSEMMFMNGIVYTIGKKRRQSGIRIFISESKFDINVSTVVKVAGGIKSVAFPDSVKNV